MMITVFFEGSISLDGRTHRFKGRRDGVCGWIADGVWIDVGSFQFKVSHQKLRLYNGDRIVQDVHLKEFECEGPQHFQSVKNAVTDHFEMVS